MPRRHAPENPVYDPRWAARMARVEPPPPLEYDPPREPRLSLIHQDDALLAFDKPALLLTVPGKPEGHGDCLEARARAAFPEAILAHRLDRPTSGVVLMARTPLARRGLARQFQKRKLMKTYVARIAGAPDRDAGEIDAPICGDWPNRPRQMVHFEHGAPSVTRWRVLAREPGVTRVELRPTTGRTHQLRVHMAWIGHAILGDEFYAPPKVRSAAPRLQLHAESVTLRHPSDGRLLTLTAPCPF